MSQSKHQGIIGYNFILDDFTFNFFKKKLHSKNTSDWYGYTIYHFKRESFEIFRKPQKKKKVLIKSQT